MSEKQRAGRPVYRKLWPGERDKLRQHLLRLDPMSRAMRFGHGVSDRYITDYCRRLDGLHTVVYGALVGGELRAAAELHVTPRTWPAEAEAAFSVEAGWQDSGIGTALMSRVLTAARNRGVKKLHMTCLPHNHRMRRIAQKHETSLTVAPDQVDAHLDPALPDHFSLFREWFDDASGLAAYFLDMVPGGHAPETVSPGPGAPEGQT
jgi:GNAT superfamily N-acetyltransferase